MDIQEGFLMNLETAAEFYKLCSEKKIDTVEGRKALLREFVKNKQVKYIRDAAELLKNKKVTHIKYKRKKQ